MKKLFSVLLLWPFAQLLAGTITTSVTSLYHFKECYVHHSTAAQWFLVSGNSLTAGVIITAPDHFEVSTDLNRFYSRTLTLPANGTLASTKVFVRFSPSGTGARSGTVEVTSAGSSAKSISVSGTGTSFPNLSAYYPVTSSTGATLKTALYSAVNAGVKSFSYDNLYTHYPSADTYYDGTVWDVYSTKVDAVSPFTFNHGVKKCGNYSKEGDCYNREHLLPQSWFSEASPMRSDIHHVLPTDGKVNGERSNLPFGEVSNPVYTSLQGAKKGPSATSGYSGTVFEPVDEYKGDIARSMLYMLVRYEDKIAGWSGTVMSGNKFPGYDQWFIDLLLKWHNQDPPGNREIIRNNYIATSACQNNRNPFIDSPQYAYKIWGGNLPAEPSVVSSGLQLSDNTGTSFTLHLKGGDGFRRLIVVRPASAAAVHPSDLTHYGAGSHIASAPLTGPQNHVVYNGTSSSVTVTGLTQGVSYTVNVYEYNGWYGTANYLTSSFASVSTAPASVEWGTLSAAQEADKSISLSWSTVKENNNVQFDIERSVGSGAYAVIGTKTPAGNSSSTRSYSFTDDTLKHPQSQGITLLTYRIRQTGALGDFSYSNTASVTQALPVPDTVIWAGFTATLLGDSRTVQLNWSTSREWNNLRFEVEKQAGTGAAFMIATISPKGNSSSIQSYSFSDTAGSGSSLVHYRVRYVCGNGTNAYSNRQSILFPQPGVVRKDSIQITGFDAQPDSTGSISVSWTVSYEGLAGKFELLRSIGSRPYQLVFSEAGSPRDQPSLSVFRDDTLRNDPAITRLAYLLRYTGHDQTYVYVTGPRIIEVPRSGLPGDHPRFDGRVYPQPFTGQLRVSMPEAGTALFTVTFTDMFGRTLISRNEQSNGGNLWLGDLHGLKSGIYLLGISDGTRSWHTRVVKQ